MAFYESDESLRLMSYVTRYISKGELIEQAKHAMTFAFHTATNIGTLTIATFMLADNDQDRYSPGDQNRVAINR